MIDPVSPGATARARQNAVSAAAIARVPILAAIEQSPLVLDAGMGTRLLPAGLDLRSDDPALWCVTHPDQVVAVHRRDVSSGAGAILTNTFGANRAWLARFGQVHQIGPINRRAVELARSAAGADRFVIGSVGPRSRAETGAAAEQATILVDEGVDAVLLETFRFPEVETVLEEVTRALGGAAPIFVSLWEWPDQPCAAAQRLVERGAAVLGFNCGPGAAAAVAFAREPRASNSRSLAREAGVRPRAEAVMSPEELCGSRSRAACA